MNYSITPMIKQIIDKLICEKAFLNDYPTPGVIFLTLDSLFKDPITRQLVSKAINQSIALELFDAVAGIASRGYLFSGMIANQFRDKGECLVQKAKSIGDTHYVQLNMTTEYSSDTLQILKNTIQPGKKYLLTDDLIATGGSVKTAINLILQCGGHVDTVLVMTELTDFRARNELEQLGVKLISLLKFSTQDLEKLQVLQRCYEQQNHQIITYQLTHHTKGNKALIKAHNNPVLTIQLASKSPLKKEAVQKAAVGLFDPLQIEVITHDSPSGVNRQPLGYDETIAGASNRLRVLEDSLQGIDNPLLVAMENGVRYDEKEQCYYDMVHVIVKKGNLIVNQTQDCCKISNDIIKALRRDNNQVILETWGDVAYQMTRARYANNPHQEQEFGGISRTDHLFNVLCQLLGTLKKTMMAPYLDDEIEEKLFNISRSIALDSKKPINNYAKKGIFFIPPTIVVSKPINFYNHGCPVEAWNIDAEKVARNSFHVFATGDAFSVILPDIDIYGANIVIHVGLNHANYSPLVLMQEALQLCRCVYEHGALSITIALPDDYHPIAHIIDNNYLILRLFKASGATKIYFYDNTYTGKLDETTLNTTLPLVLSNQLTHKPYHINQQDLCAYLQPSTTDKNSSIKQRVDHQVMQVIRRQHLKHIWSKFDTDTSLTPTFFNDNLSLATLSLQERSTHSHIVIAGLANKPLAQKIAASLRMRGEMVRFYFIEGQGNNATIPDNVAICGAVVTIIQSTRPNPDYPKDTEDYQKNGASTYLFEAMTIAYQAHLRGAQTINLINPYQFNARSDKAENNPRGRTGAYVQQNGMLLIASKINHVITAECHDNHTMTGVYTGKGIKGSVVAALSIISTKLAQEWLKTPQLGQLRLVAPDAGAAKRTKELTEQLQEILGNKLCQTRVLGEKQRDSHNDSSALISSLNSGSVGINSNDRYLITDDEIATGNTLCQAVENLSNNGAKDIVVVVVHNNMPLNWLLRQLCLARFFYLGVTQLHFSDTHEMGTLAKDYEDLITGYAQRYQVVVSDVEVEVFSWFKDNIAKKFFDKSNDYLIQAYSTFKAMFKQLNAHISVHSLADNFANNALTKPYTVNPQVFDHKVGTFIKKINAHHTKCIVALAGASLPAASATALALNIPLHVIPQALKNTVNQCYDLPNETFALIGTPNEWTLERLANTLNCAAATILTMCTQEDIDDDCMIIAHKLAPTIQELEITKNSIDVTAALSIIETLYTTIQKDFKLRSRPVKLLGIGDLGHVMAGKLCHLLYKKDILVGIAAVDNQVNLSTSSIVYKSHSDREVFCVDRNSLNLGDVCIAIGQNLTTETITAINNLATTAKIHCACYVSVSEQGLCCVTKQNQPKIETHAIYLNNLRNLYFSKDPVDKKEVTSHRINNQAIASRYY